MEYAIRTSGEISGEAREGEQVQEQPRTLSDMEQEECAADLLLKPPSLSLQLHQLYPATSDTGFVASSMRERHSKVSDEEIGT